MHGGVDVVGARAVESGAVVDGEVGGVGAAFGAGVVAAVGAGGEDAAVGAVRGHGGAVVVDVAFAVQALVLVEETWGNWLVLNTLKGRSS